MTTRQTLVSIDVKVTGPVADRSTSPAVQRMAGAMVQSVVQLGEERLTLMARPRPGGVFLAVHQAKRGHASVGNFRRTINAETRELHARISTNSIYGPWLEGVSSRNDQTRFKGYAMFRRTREWLQGQVPQVVRVHMARFTQKLK